MEPAVTDAPNRQPAHGGQRLAHVMPIALLLGVFAALMVLTVLTVAAAQIDLGTANLLIALAIATLKASLVALYFMHLRYDNPFYALIFVVGLLFLAFFLALTLLDTLQYRPDVEGFLEKMPL